MKQSEFFSFGPFVLKFTLVLAVLKERLNPEFGEDWLTEYEEIDHYLIQLSSKSYIILPPEKQGILLIIRKTMIVLPILHNMKEFQCLIARRTY